MTIKIKATMAWGEKGEGYARQRRLGGEVRVRIVREADWKRLMKLIRAIEEYDGDGDAVESIPADVWAAYDALKGAK